MRLQVAGPRYNANRGILKISCDRYRQREDNKRQAMQWAVRLVEAALITHPSDEWEQLKARQQNMLESLQSDDRADRLMGTANGGVGDGSSAQLGAGTAAGSTDVQAQAQ